MKFYYKIKFYFSLIASLGLALISVSCSLNQSPQVENKLSASGTQYNLISYTNTLATVKVSGSLPESVTIPMSTVEVHLTDDCSDTPLAQGIAENFVKTGFDVQLPFSISNLNPTFNFYVSTNSFSGCMTLGTYQLSIPRPAKPNLSRTVPASPSRETSEPSLFGTALTNSTVKFYKDSACSQLVGSGTNTSFNTQGIQITLPQNTTQTIYGLVEDALAQKSDCTQLTTYRHVTTGPSAPIFRGISPSTPTKQGNQAVITATTSNDAVAIKYFSDAGCSSEIAAGTPSSASTSGLTITGVENVPMTVYAKSFDAETNPSTCSFLTNFHYDTTPPSSPTFQSTNPPSPTRLTLFPKVKGLSSADTVTLKFFKDALCLTNVGVGTKGQFENTGINVSVDENSITSIYAAAFDQAGNQSPCVLFSNYKHNTIPPSAPVFGGTNPVSPNNTSSAPYIYGNASPTTQTVKFYRDESCSLNIGEGTSADFNDETRGVQVITPAIANAINTTNIYATSIDEEGNIGDCTYLTTYGYSTAKAIVPTFSQTIPASPARTSNRPYILGDSHLSISTVKLYSDNSCSAELGHANRQDFKIQGIQVTLPSNTVSNIYIKSFDVYGNASDCTYFTQFTHDNIALPDPSFVSFTPSSPTRATDTPLLTGSVITSVMGKPLTANSIKIYDSLLCIFELNRGTPSDFTGAGISITVAPNSTTSVYARSSDAAGNTSNCTYLSDFTYSTNPPGIPILSSATPGSPSFSRPTTLKGTFGANNDIVSNNQVFIYKDSSCSSLSATGSVADFLGAGIAVIADRNATTRFYGKSVDVVGSASACSPLIDFRHYDNGPANLTGIQNPNGSIELSWSMDSVASPSPKYTVKRSEKSGGPYKILEWQNSGVNFTDSTVSNNKTYFYVVATTNSTGSSLNSAEFAITTNTSSPTTPLTLASQPGEANVYLTWTGSMQNLYYKVYRSTNPNGPYSVIAQNQIATAYTDVSVTNGVTYYYRVTGINSSNQSFYSNETSATPLVAPPAPQNLTVQSDNYCMNFSWSPSPYFVKFQLLRGTSSGSFSTLITTTSSNYRYCYVDNISAANYFFAVRATWGSTQTEVYSANSNVVKFRPNIAPTISIRSGNGQNYLNWTATSQFQVSFQIWRSPLSGWPNASYTLLDGAYSGTSYYDSGLTNGSTYYYTVIANYASTEGLVSGYNSDEVSGVPLANPTEPTNLNLVKSPSNGNALLSWSPSTHYNSFNIYRATSLAGTYGFVGNSTSNNYEDAPTSAGTYYYKVTTVWGSYESIASNIVSMNYAYVSNVTASATATAITLNWTPEAGLTYNILRSTTSGGPFTQIGTASSGTFVNSTTAPSGKTASSGVGYFYSVQPVNGGYTGTSSPEVGIMLTGATTPSGVSVTGTTSSTVDLKWVIISGTSSYTVYRATAVGGPYTSMGTVSSNTYSASGLSTNTLYYFKVARTSCTTSCQSTAVSAVTNSTPAAPSLSPGNGLITVNWTGVAGASSYDLLRSTDNTNYSVIKSGATGGVYVDTVTNGTQYFYKTRANHSAPGSATLSPASLGATAGKVPATPSNLQITNNSTGTSVDFTWGAIGGVSQYNLYVSTTSGSYSATPSASSSGTVGTVNGLTAGQKYYVIYKAAIGSYESAASPEISFIAMATPAAPIVAVTTTSISLNWTAIPGAASYKILRSNDSSIFSQIAANVGTTTYSDSSVLNNTSYYYKYIPVDASGAEMAPSAASLPISIVPILAPPQIFARALTSSSAIITWSSSSSPQATNYILARSLTSGGPYTNITTLSITDHEYTDSSLSADTNYFYVIKAITADNNESPNSTEVSVVTSTGATSLTATGNTNKIDLAWAADPSATQYIVRKSLSSGQAFFTLTTLAPGVTSYTDTQVNTGQTYYYLVSALHGSQTAIDSNEATASTNRRMNLQVPIEMIDQPLSSDLTTITFERSRTSLDPTAYDGTITYDFEIVGQNTDTTNAAIELVDGNNNNLSTLSLPANTVSNTRIRTSFTPNAGAQELRLKLPASTNPDQIKIYSARILINQTNASMTKIYFPLLGSGLNASAGDVYSPITGTSSTTYASPANAVLFSRLTGIFGDIVEFNAWELEVLGSSYGGQGTVALMNVSTGNIVEDSEIEITSFESVSLGREGFSNNTTEFETPTNDNQNYRLVFKCYKECSAGPVNLYKAGLWVKVENLSKVRIPFRVGYGQNATQVLIDPSLFSSPTFKGGASLTNPPGVTSQVQIIKKSDSSAISQGLLDFSTDGLQQIINTSPMPLSSPVELSTDSQSVNGTPTTQGVFIYIDSHN